MVSVPSHPIEVAAKARLRTSIVRAARRGRPCCRGRLQGPKPEGPAAALLM